MLGLGAVGSRANVPWSAVGTGWFLVIDDSAPAHPASPFNDNGTATLWLVDPLGGRYKITSWNQRDATVLGLQGLMDWSGDGRRALFSGGDLVTEVDLVTGRQRSVHAQATGAVYTMPTGANVALSLNVYDSAGYTTGAQVERIDLSSVPWGTTAAAPVVKAILLKRPTPLGVAIYSPDGTTVYEGTGNSLEAASNAGSPTGTPERTIVVDPAATDCQPVRWWTSTQLLVSCFVGGGNQLWLVDPLTGASAPLTATPTGTELGFGDAFTVGGSVYLLHYVGCGAVNVQRLNAKGLGTDVAIPRSLGSDALVGTTGANNDELAIVSTSEDCQPTSWFGYVDPIRHVTHIVMAGAGGGIGPIAALAFGRE